MLTILKKASLVALLWLSPACEITTTHEMPTDAGADASACGECTAPTAVCEETLAQCVQCTGNAHCSELTASLCSANECSPCTDNPDCSHLADTPLCNDGTCIQ